jgi:hypothetical protein
MKYSSSKEINTLVKSLIRVGWKYFRGTKHGRIRAPSGYPTLTIPNTPSDYRASMNFKQDVRRVSF